MIASQLIQKVKSLKIKGLISSLSKTDFEIEPGDQELDLRVATTIFGFHKKIGPNFMWADGKRKEYKSIPKFSSDQTLAQTLIDKINEFKIPIEIEIDDSVSPAVWILYFDKDTYRSTNLCKILCEAMLSIFK